MGDAMGYCTMSEKNHTDWQEAFEKKRQQTKQRAAANVEGTTPEEIENLLNEEFQPFDSDEMDILFKERHAEATKAGIPELQSESDSLFAEARKGKDQYHKTPYGAELFTSSYDMLKSKYKLLLYKNNLLEREYEQIKHQIVDYQMLQTDYEVLKSKYEDALKQIENESLKAPESMAHVASQERVIVPFPNAHDATRHAVESLIHEDFQAEHEALRRELESLNERYQLDKQKAEEVKTAFETLKEEHGILKKHYEALKSEHTSLAIMERRFPNIPEAADYQELLKKHNSLLNDRELDRQRLDRLQADYETLKLKYEILRTDYAVILPRYEALKGSDTEKLGYQALIHEYELEKQEFKIEKYEHESLKREYENLMREYDKLKAENAAMSEIVSNFIS